MKQVRLHFMENRSKSGFVTFGTPWKQGEVSESDGFKIVSDGMDIPVQSKATAYWQDGSIKWSSHTVNADRLGESIELVAGADNVVATCGMEVTDREDEIIVNTKTLSVSFAKSGELLIKGARKDNRTGLNAARLVCILEEREERDNTLIRKEVRYIGSISSAAVYETGPIKTVIKAEGIHKDALTGRKTYPFIVYFTIHNESDSIGITHTFFCDIMETDKYFLKGIGIEFEVPMTGEAYNRHIKIAGDFGYMDEPLQLVTAWRPKFSPEIYRTQTMQQKVDLCEEPVARGALFDIPIWGSYRMYQSSSRFFQLKKKVNKDNVAYIDANFGGRAKGIFCVDSENGAVAIANKDFWQKYPSSIWADDLDKSAAKLTMWFWSPEAEALDYRHYETAGHSQSYYEGADEVRSTPYGIANTNDLKLYFFSPAYSMVADEVLEKCCEEVQKSAQLLCDPEYYHDMKAFGEWALIKKDTPLRTWLEEQLDAAFDFYKNEVEQRNWYGLYNYGDFMHTYDRGRHSWKYDMGGFAWQNTELCPTLWLWYAFLRSGREDIFTMAEAMSRHAGDVDMYHFGEYKGIGSRHNVLHWGDSCKEARIAMAGHHRVLYYITGGDYRIGDVMDSAVDADYSLLNIDPLRVVLGEETTMYPTHARSGPDWSTFTSNWMTAWERRKDTKYRDKIVTGLNDIKATPFKLFSGTMYEYDPETGHLGYIGENTNGSHLALCMGGPQTWFELADLLEDEEFKDMLADYGAFYWLPKEEKRRLTDGKVRVSPGWAYPYMAASIAAYGANRKKDAKLGYQVWQVLVHSLAGKDKKDAFDAEIVENYFNNERLVEMFWISTNFTAQWCLNTIVALGLAEEYLPEKIEDCEWEDWVK